MMGYKVIYFAFGGINIMKKSVKSVVFVLGMIAILRILSAFTITFPSLNSLPAKYTYEMAENNGDVIMGDQGKSNFEKMNVFYDNVNHRKDDMIRVTGFTTEGGVIILDVIYKSGNLTVTRDNTRDGYSDRKITTYKAIKITKDNKIAANGNELTYYTAQLENGDMYTLAAG
jgi:hypothetical protein